MSTSFAPPRLSRPAQTRSYMYSNASPCPTKKPYRLCERKWTSWCARIHLQENHQLTSWRTESSTRQPSHHPFHRSHGIGAAEEGRLRGVHPNGIRSRRRHYRYDEHPTREPPHRKRNPQDLLRYSRSCRSYASARSAPLASRSQGALADFVCSLRSFNDSSTGREHSALFAVPLQAL